MKTENLKQIQGPKWILWLLPFLIGIGGVVPNILFSLDKGEVTFFKSGFDEDTYADRALTQRPRSDRVISSYAYKFIYRLAGSNHGRAFVLCDFLFPMLVTFLALLLAAQFTSSVWIQSLMTLGLLFGQEFLSMGSSALWPQSWALWNIFSQQNGFSQALRVLFPYAGTSSFVLYRTPDPQVSWCVFLLFFIIWNKVLDQKTWSRKHLAALVILYGVLLPFTYIFVILSVLVLSLFMILVLVLKKQWHHFLWLSGLFLLMSLVKFSYDKLGDNGHLGFIYGSHLPTILWGSFYSIILTGVFIFVLKKRQKWNERLLFYAFVAALPLVLSNQQVVTGRLVSPSSYEIYVHYPLLVLAGAYLTRLLFESGYFRRRPTWMVVFLSIIIISGVIYGLRKTYQDWYFHNDISFEYLALLNKHSVDGEKVVLKDSPETAPLMEIRQNNKINFAINFNTAQDQLVSDMINAHTPPAGRQWHEETVFNYSLHLGYSEKDFSNRLKDEIELRAGMFLLPFLFSIKDCWFPLTEYRQYKVDWMIAQLADLEKKYSSFISNAQTHESYLLAQQPVAETFKGFRNQLIDSKKVRYGMIYLYRQIPTTK